MTCRGASGWCREMAQIELGRVYPQKWKDAEAIAELNKNET